MISRFCVFLSLATVLKVQGFSTSLISAPFRETSSLHLSNDPNTFSDDGEVHMNRRSSLSFLSTMLTTSAAAVALGPLPSMAATSYPQAESDKKKIVSGYKRLEYLLNNWEKETTVCKRNDNPYQGCDRTPEKVMEYLGFKSMEDPLFRADKTMIRLQALIPPNDKQAELDFQDAIDTWLEKAEEGNGMAFISSWGEANPGGGRDRIALFIERSKKDVIESKDSLATVIRVLKLKVD